MARKHKHIPQTRYPMNLEMSYLRSMKRVILSWKKAAQFYADYYLKHYVTGGVISIDADDDQKNDPQKIDQIALFITLMAIAIKNTKDDNKLASIASQFVLSINSFSLSNVNSQTTMLGMQAIASDPTIQAFIKAKIKENTSYITSLRDNYIAQLRNDIYRSISNGGGVTELTKAIVKRTGMAYSHARLIANDQTGSILAQLNSYRAKRAGFEKYMWQSMEDGRVRPKHQELDRKVFRYDDPDGGDNGMLPGEPINCRCVAVPVLDDE